MDYNRSASRIEYIDLAKGICIILVVIQHCGIDIPILGYLRMPFYFFLSGLFFKTYGSLKNLCLMKTNKLLIPYVSFSIIGALSVVFMTALKSDTISFYDLFHPMFFERFDKHDGPIWFLLCLFWCNFIYFFVSKINNKIIKTIVVIAISVLGLYLWYIDFPNGIRFSTASVALPFFYIGSTLRNVGILNLEISKMRCVIMAIIGFITVYLFDKFIFHSFVVWSAGNVDGNIVVYYLLAIILIFCILLLCKSIIKLPVVSYCGRYSVMILVIHMLIIRYFGFVGPYLSSGKVANVINVLVVLSISIACIPLMRKYLPYITCQKDVFKIKK